MRAKLPPPSLSVEIGFKSQLGATQIDPDLALRHNVSVSERSFYFVDWIDLICSEFYLLKSEFHLHWLRGCLDRPSSFSESISRHCNALISLRRCFLLFPDWNLHTAIAFSLKWRERMTRLGRRPIQESLFLSAKLYFVRMAGECVKT